MIVTSPSAWLAMLAMVVLSSATGYAISRQLPWSIAARIAGVPGIVGIALGPFLSGIGGVLALGMLPGDSHAAHLAAVVVWQFMLVVLAMRRRGPIGRTGNTPAPRQFGEYLFTALLTGWLVLLLVNSIALPVSQNDPLEYATVARLVYETRDLGSYPAIHPEQSDSGFFGPWTHPPMYVAIMYLAQAIQGHADEPGVARLIAPWLTVCATFLVLALGALISRLVGILSAVVFLSTPLLFSGSVSAMIDPLPVLGIGLIAVAMLCIEAGPAVRGAITGGALALALWTHSQSVLFVPMALGAIALQNGARRLRSTATESGSLCCIAILFGAWPYWRNLLIFGSPISDNPAVFALPALDWPAYFSYARGLDNWAAIVQYGLLKGWFSLQAYGWSFWLMTLGTVLAVTRLRQPTWHVTLVEGGRQALDHGSQVLWVSLTLVAIYLGGCLTSTLAGLDLMIKNDRYMLVIHPFVAILAGYGAQKILGRCAAIVAASGESMPKREVLSLAGFVLGLVFGAQLFVVGWYYHWRNVPHGIVHALSDTPAEAEQKKRDLDKPPFQRTLEYLPNMAAMFWIRENLPKDALVLSLRPADMYYAQRKMVSYLDERLLHLYGETSVPQAAQLLRNLGVTHLHVPDYGLPASYNSVLDRIIDEPTLSRLVYWNGGTRIFRLESTYPSSSTDTRPNRLDFTPGRSEWTQYRQYNLVGRKASSALGVGAGLLFAGGMSVTQWAVPVFHRDFSTFLASGVGVPLGTARPDSLLSVHGNREYRVAFDLEGNAFVKIWLAQYDQNGALLMALGPSKGVDRITEVVLAEGTGVKRVSHRFLSHPQAAYVRFGIEHVGHSRVHVQRAVLEYFEVAVEKRTP